MSKHGEPVDPEQIIGYGIRVIPDIGVLERVFESVGDSVAVGISNDEIRAALEKTLERYDR